jgi:outer membrane protein
MNRDMNISVYNSAFAVLVLTGGSIAAPLHGQERPVTLEEAVAEAQARHPDVLMAEAQAEAARAGSRSAQSFRYPGVVIETGWMRSDDPVAAFGTRLRQARFAEEHFDPARLNAPAPLSDWSSGVLVGWTPLDLSSLAGYRAAARQAEAAGQGAAWARRAAGFRAQIRYMESVGAVRHLDAATQALESALENLRLVEARVREGLLNEAELLQARAATEGARAQQVMAEQRVADALDGLALALGWDAGWTPVPTDTVFVLAPGRSGELALRPDIRAQQLEVEAAEAQVAQASRARLPVIEAFGHLRTHAPELGSGIEENWTVGIQIRVPLFTGFHLESRRVAADAVLRAAREAARMKSQEAAREIQQAERAIETMRAHLVAAEAALVAADEAARLLSQRFEEGMATTAELLAAQAQTAHDRARALDAELGLLQTLAHLAFLTQPLGEGMDR